MRERDVYTYNGAAVIIARVDGSVITCLQGDGVSFCTRASELSHWYGAARYAKDITDLMVDLNEDYRSHHRWSNLMGVFTELTREPCDCSLSVYL